MKSLVIIFSMFLALNVTAKTQMTAEDYSTTNIEYVTLENEIFDIEHIVFEDLYNVEEEVTIDQNLLTQAILSLGKINSYKNRFLRYSIITFSIAITAEIAIIILLYWTIVFK